MRAIKVRVFSPSALGRIGQVYEMLAPRTFYTLLPIIRLPT